MAQPLRPPRLCSRLRLAAEAAAGMGAATGAVMAAAAGMATAKMAKGEQHPCEFFTEMAYIVKRHLIRACDHQSRHRGRHSVGAACKNTGLMNHDGLQDCARAIRGAWKPSS